MRAGGFPCRLVGCLESFQVLDQKSMASLHAASAARTDHEVARHDYHHVRLPDEQVFSPASRRTTPKTAEHR
jgi:hypothetical protein